MDVELTRERMQEILEALPTGFSLFDAENRLVLTNARNRVLFAAIVDLMVPGTPFDVLLRETGARGVWAEPIPDIDEWVDDRTERFRESRDYAERQTAAGQWLRMDQYRMENGETIIVQAEVTDIKRRQQLLDARTNILQATLDSVSHGIGAFDAERRLVVANARLAEMLGATEPLSVSGGPDAPRPTLDSMVPADDPGMLALVAAVGQVGGGESEHARADGRLIAAKSVGLPDGGLVVTLTDVTDARRAAAELSNRARFYRMLTRVAWAAEQEIGLGGAIATMLDALVTYAGAALGHVHLYETGRDGAAQSAEVWHPAQSARFAPIRAAAAAWSSLAVCDDLPSRAVAAKALRTCPDLALDESEPGRLLYATGLRSGLAFPLLAAGELFGVVECYFDTPGEPDAAVVHVIGYMASQLGRLVERTRIQRLKAEFVSTVSHELRTPLTAIRGALGLLLGAMGGSLPEQPRGLVEIAQRNVERLVALVNDILDIEKIEAGKIEFRFEPVPLESLVEEALQANQAYADGCGVTLTLDAGDAATVMVDPQRMQQVLANLLSNAAKFSPRGAKVVVATRQVDGVAEIAVTDFGSGIAASFQPRVFERFAQADASDARAKAGTGLGLSISRAIVERHGGSIGFASRPGLTRFHVRLPLATAPARSVSSGAADRPRILVCEDDRVTASMLAALIERDGFVVDHARTAAEARELLASVRYAAMTLDLKLPDGDGMALFRTLRDDPRYAELPVIVVSVTPERRSEALGAPLGDAVWLSKPVDPARLSDALLRMVPPVRQRPSVLHVEGDPDLAQVVRRMLGDAADVVVAGSLVAARKALARRRFDLVLLDTGLADGSGLALLDELGADGPPVLVFSAEDVAEPDGALDGRIVATLVKARTSERELVDRILSLVRAGIGPSAETGGSFGEAA